MHKYNMYVYPSIFEETSCISLLESMAGGLYCITTNLGAIFETGAEFPMYIPFDDNYKRLASKFVMVLKLLLTHYMKNKYIIT